MDLAKSNLGNECFYDLNSAVIFYFYCFNLLIEMDITMFRFVFLALILSGCTSSSGVIQDGKNAYRIMHTGDTGFTNSGTLQKNTYKEASAFCEKQGKIVETITMDSKQSRPLGGWPEATLIFKCTGRSN
ncbi:hypothetical protein [Photobacterium phosphoreum]|jgi:hypothetical protein|uniref:hypothetical protein n=1 Tax=Photobacterium phosphoreum TaxID=659 RepID=UPI000D17C562|nr:hypothetical protein [Photobacterium phosphoreum]PTB30967.1 hypothetical protein DAT36_19485 [Photobacterium phosphoreum]